MPRSFDNERVHQLLDLIHSDPVENERDALRRTTIESAWRHVTDYVGMLTIAADRWQAEADAYAAKTKKKLEAMREVPSGRLTRDEWDRDWHESLTLRLDEETLYVFGNILLDRIALAIKHTLFDGRGPLEGHSQVARSLETQADEHGLLPPARLLELVAILEGELSENVRDKLIAHLHAPGHVRTGFARAVNIHSGETSLSPFVIAPKNEAEAEPRAALETAALVDHLYEYANEVAAWVLAVVTERRS